MNNKEIVSQVKHAFGIHRWIAMYHSPNPIAYPPYNYYRCKYCSTEMARDRTTGEERMFYDPIDRYESRK